MSSALNEPGTVFLGHAVHFPFRAISAPKAWGAVVELPGLLLSLGSLVYPPASLADGAQGLLSLALSGHSHSVVT